MKKALKWGGIVLIIALIVIQFIPKNYPENKPANENDILAYHQVSDEVSSLLKTSCYDCHSNQIKYPWYSNVAPVSFLISHDIEEGLSELNFSEWGTYERKKMIDKLDELKEEVEEGEMPLPIYTLVHGEAKLTAEQRELMEKWAEELMNEIVNQ